MEHVGTDKQVADIFTKPLPEALFTKYRKSIMGWYVETDESWTHVIGKKKGHGIKEQQWRTKKFRIKESPGASGKIRRLS